MTKKKLVGIIVVVFIAIIGLSGVVAKKGNTKDNNDMTVDNQGHTDTFVAVEPEEKEEVSSESNSSSEEKGGEASGDSETTETSDDDTKMYMIKNEDGTYTVNPDVDVEQSNGTVVESRLEKQETTGVKEVSSDTEELNDQLGIYEQVNNIAVANRINEIYSQNSYESCEIKDQPAEDEIDDMSEQCYVVKFNYDYWIISYYPLENSAISMQDKTGNLAMEYEEPEEDIEWFD